MFVFPTVVERVGRVAVARVTLLMKLFAYTFSVPVYVRLLHGIPARGYPHAACWQRLATAHCVVIVPQPF